MAVCEAKTAQALLLGGLGVDLVLNVAGDDGSVAAPDVHCQGKIMTDAGNLVVIDGVVDDREGAGAGGALQVLELVDGDRSTNAAASASTCL